MKRAPQLAYFALILVPLMGACNKSSVISNPAPISANESGSSPLSATGPQDERGAITEAIHRHLNDNRGINLSAMEINVSDVAVNGDQAQVETEFRLKQGGTSMLMTYFLERHGGGWIVVRNQPSGAGQFAHPPMDKIHSGAAAPTLPDLNAFLKKQSSPKPN